MKGREGRVSAEILVRPLDFDKHVGIAYRGAKNRDRANLRMKANVKLTGNGI